MVTGIEWVYYMKWTVLPVGDNETCSDDIRWAGGEVMMTMMVEVVVVMIGYCMVYSSGDGDP